MQLKKNRYIYFLVTANMKLNTVLLWSAGRILWAYPLMDSREASRLAIEQPVQRYTYDDLIYDKQDAEWYYIYLFWLGHFRIFFSG